MAGMLDADLVDFCRAEHPRLVGALSLHTGDRDVAEELAQETLLRVVDRWEQVRAADRPGAWAHRVAMNLAASWFRRRAAEGRAVRRLDQPEVDHQPDTAAVLAVRRAVAGLSERRRRCLILRHHLGHSVAETAELMGISELAVRSLAHRAVADLRRALTDSDPEEALHAR